MDPLVVHGILLATALVLLVLMGLLWLRKVEGKKRYIGVVPLVYVVCVLILVALAIMEG